MLAGVSGTVLDGSGVRSSALTDAFMKIQQGGA